jgi:Ca2+-dependent lipid-binding protein
LVAAFSLSLSLQNVPFFVDVIRRRTSWQDPRSYEDRMLMQQQYTLAGQKVLLRVEVLEGEGLAAKSSDHSSDPYCYVTQHFRNGLPRKGKVKTKTKKHTLYPRWEAEDRNVLELSVNQQNNALVHIRDANVVLRDDPLGVVNLNLSSLPWCQVPCSCSSLMF